MEGMEEKLGAILGNPDMMKQIMSMAQSLGSPPPPETPKPPSDPGIDPAMLQHAMTLIRGSGIDPHQQSLLQALEPYLSCERIGRLQRAMRAAKLASLATQFLGGGYHV